MQESGEKKVSSEPGHGRDAAKRGTRALKTPLAFLATQAHDAESGDAPHSLGPPAR